ncbi:DNA-binding transcriptional regulator, MerR family [Sinosporangium album]|uniref:DNA-binding transcriptional regulator, MerR family n=1 Tax=Sinosporangium album TaxID=504805 RepID=A0A1G8GLP4_9ACTN|nr:MerR family transcriptional regulator [Sinosporangium album]SDH95220.1 DNA-binding transcriptional regulator, MerR family [Sinosporangium album]
MRIGELAERVGVSTRALRYYEQHGLLSSAREGNGYRDFDELAVVRARNIKHLLDAGLTVEDVQGYAAHGCLDRPLNQGPRCAAELETTGRRLAELDERMERLRRHRERLAAHQSALEALG